ncbi:hypothetical protein V1478_010803, partial [Vespula squamosa]
MLKITPTLIDNLDVSALLTQRMTLNRSHISLRNNTKDYSASARAPIRQNIIFIHENCVAHSKIIVLSEYI